MLKFFHIPVILLIVIGFAACAKTGTPFGGPKDEDPPVVVKTIPPENSVNFVPQKKIIIVFDEYIQLKNIFQEMMISPPIEGEIEALLRGKAIAIEFPKDAHFDTVTYTLSFGNAIVDNNESNVLENYEYVFSLKDYIDTLHVQGRIVNSFNYLPDEERMLVMLYRNLNDSAPLLEKPSYICRSDEEGNFSIKNISSGRYRIFGLKDMNQNMLFDLPTEQIAFSDSILDITAERFSDNIIIEDSVLYDSIITTSLLLQDSLPAPADSLTKINIADSLAKQRLYTVFTELFYFTEEVYNQYLTDYSRPRKEQLKFIFNEPLADTFELTPINFSTQNSDWFLLDSSSENDTLIFWITDTAYYGMDSIRVELCYPLFDSTGNMYEKADTFLLRKPKEETVKRNKKRKTLKGELNDTIPDLKLTNNVSSPQNFDLNKNIEYTSPSPIAEILLDSIRLFRIEDSLQIPIESQTHRIGDSFYKFSIDFNSQEETIYKLFVPDMVITDIYGLGNDTIDFRFRTRPLSYYGTLGMDLKNVRYPLVLQLMDEKENVLRERQLTQDGMQKFEYLPAGKYKMKIIVDINGNGKWDTGNYLQKLQPEKVLYYQGSIEIRSNWEMEFIWDIIY